jgi:hypothetical protein
MTSVEDQLRFDAQKRLDDGYQRDPVLGMMMPPRAAHWLSRLRA